MQRAASTGESTFDALIELTTSDGRRTEFVASAVPLLDERGEPRGAIGTLQDVSALRRIEAALQVSQERFRVAQESSLVAFTILKAVRDAAGHVVDFEWEYANKAAARILKRPVERLIGARLLAELPGNRSDSPLFDTYVEVVETGVARTVQLTYDADGVRGTFLNAASKLGDAVAVWFMDLTERQALIEELRATEASLREADRQKDEFLATLAHELRNPMAPIRYAAAMIRPGVAAGIARACTADDRAAVGADVATARRPARHEPHHAQRDRTQARTRRRAARRRGRRRQCTARGARRTAAAHRADAATARVGRRRPGAPRAGRPQPAAERHQVHAGRTARSTSR